MWVVLLLLKIILYLLAALLLFLITILVVPFTYKGEAAVGDGISFSYRIGWFWNLFSIRGKGNEENQANEVFLGNRRLFAINMNKEEKPDIPEKTNKKEVKKAVKKENNFKSMFDVHLIREGLSFLTKIFKQISPKHLQLQGSYGFEDPSITGMTAGFIYTLQGIWPQGKINLMPSFTEEILDVELKAAGTIQTVRLVWDSVRFLLKKEIRTKIFKRNKKVKQKLN